MNIIPPEMRTRNQFVCPKCAHLGGFFGTFEFHISMAKHPFSPWRGKGYKSGDSIGHCNAKVHVLGSTCEYEWVRTLESDKKHFVQVPLEYPT